MLVKPIFQVSISSESKQHFSDSTYVCMYVCMYGRSILRYGSRQMCLFSNSHSNRGEMPCAECGSYVSAASISWHPCEGSCVKWNPTEQTWIAITTDSLQIVRCSRAWNGSFWFFYCRDCKDREVPLHVLRGARIVMSLDHGVDYETDSSNNSDSSSDSASSNHTDSSSDSDSAQSRPKKLARFCPRR